MINISLKQHVTIKYTYIVQSWRQVDFLIRGFSCNIPYVTRRWSTEHPGLLCKLMHSVSFQQDMMALMCHTLHGWFSCDACFS